MEYAIISYGGKQYKVNPGLKLDIEGVGKVGENVRFDKVLLLVSDSEAKIGTPIVSGFTVEGKVISNKKGEKVRVFKFKAKSKYRKTIGFRQSFTTVEILPFGKSEKKSSVKAKSK